MINGYKLDNSGSIHLASRRKNYTNTFRISITLKTPVDKNCLQEAVNRMTGRFPTIIAGIRSGFFHYRVVSGRPPQVKQEQECLAPMTREKIKNCGVRVLYHENVITTEFFHSMTDGYGGMVVTCSIAAEYLRIKYSVFIPETDLILSPDSNISETELEDKYFTFAGKKAAAPDCQRAYLLSDSISETGIKTTHGKYQAADIINISHHYGVTVTTFLTAVLMCSILDIQQKHLQSSPALPPIRIMVPVNLRNIFHTTSFRNFSLYAIADANFEDFGQDDLSFENLVTTIDRQLAEQINAEHMAAAMAMNTKAEQFPLYRILPLPVKCAILRLSQRLFGERSSCMSLSNLGVISLPEQMECMIDGMEFALTPRIKSPYNCGVVSFGGIINITFSRRCANPELEKNFFDKLERIMKAV